jgi:uncharacterized membrane protein
MEKSPPNQIVNLHNNFILSQNLFLLILKGVLLIKLLLSNCASLFALLSRENIFAFSTKKVEVFNFPLESFQQKTATSLLTNMNLYDFLYKIQLSVYLSADDIKNYNKKPTSIYMSFLLLDEINVLSILKNITLVFICMITIFNLK